MKVYKIQADSDTYKYISFDDVDYDCDKLITGGKQKIKNWEPPRQTFIVNSMAESGTFTCLDGSLDFAIWGSYSTILSPFFLDYAELLQVKIPGDKIYIVNITVLIDCLNYEKCLFRGGEEYFTKNIADAYDVETYSFDAKKFGVSSLFRLNAGPIFPLVTFCYEGVKANPEDEFKYFVEKHNLKGLDFILVWDSEKE